MLPKENLLIMNKLLLFFSIIVLICSCSSAPEKYTELAEYGYKGPVEYVLTKKFDNAEKINGKWECSDYGYFMSRSYHFNKDGFIDTINSKVYFNDFRYDTQLTFTFRDGDKVGSIMKDNNGETTYHVYEWEDEYNYSYKPAGRELNATFESYTELNENFRDFKGISKDYKDGELVFSETYTNYFDEDGTIERTRLVDEFTSKVITHIYSDKILDEYGNIIECAVIDSASGELIQYMKRTFTYYED